ncbi:MAG: hypothetical protein U0270_23105 [Labilithrix sp.]
MRSERPFDRRLLALGLALPTLAMMGCRDFFILSDEATVTGGDGGSSSGVDGASSSGSSSSSGTPRPDGGNEAGAGAFCEPGKSLFCDSFDDANPGQMWTAQAEHGRFIETTFASAPRAFELAFPDQGGEGVDYLAKNLAFPADANLRLEVAIRLTTDDDVYPVGLFFSNDHRLVLNLDGFVNETEGTTQNGGHKYTKAPIDGQFHRYVFSLERLSNTVELTIDGSVALAKTTLVNANMLGDGTVKLAIGVYYAPSNTPWTGTFDDVRVTTF